MKGKQLLFASVLAGLALVLLLTILRPIQAAPPGQPMLVPGNPVTNPVSNTHTASPNTTVSITYDEAISAATVSTQTFAVHAMQTGLLNQTYGVNGGAISLTPIQPFKPGELVQVSATTGTLNLSGQGPISPTIWQFRTAVADGSGVFVDSGQSLGSSASDNVGLGDVDSDGDLDAFVANYGHANRVWLNNGSGTFIDSGQNLGSLESQAVVLGDLDGDGDLDAFVVNFGFSQPNKVWLNNGSGTFTDSGQSIGNSASVGLSLGDLDADGDLDAFVGNVYGNPNKIWLNDGAGIFTDGDQSLGSSNSEAVALGDLDGDGDLDAFVANCGCPGSQPDKVWFNDGKGTFIEGSQALGNSPSHSVALGDLDDDGDLDAFVTNVDNQADKVWLNNGTGIFTDSGQSLGGSSSRSVALGDVDGDGDLDAFVGNGHISNQANEVWLNNGAGTFSDSGQNLGSSSSNGVSLGDLDGDGDLDAFIGNAYGQANKVWLNQNWIELSPPAQTNQGGRGQLVAHEGTLLNTTGATDSFSLTLSSQVWNTTLSTDSLGPVANSDSITFTVYVTVPVDAAWYLTDTVTVTATSIASPTVYSDTATFTTQAYAPPKISVSPDILTRTQYVNEIVTKTLTISNGNGVTLTFNIVDTSVPDAVLLMHLDEPAGTTTFQDASGNNNHGSCSGTSCPTAGVDGKFGKALSFDGSNDYVIVGSPVPLALQIQNEISLEAWIYVTDYPASHTLGTIVGCQYDPGSRGYAIHLDGRTNPDGQSAPPGHIHFQIGDGNWHVTNANAQVPLNQWVHIVAIRKANEDGQVYYNAVLQPSTSVPWTGSIAYSGTELDLGRQSDYGNRFFNGVIDEVAIYNQALSAQEVEALYLSGAGGRDVPWLSTAPISGTVATNSSMPVQVTLDATGLQPDTYTTQIHVRSNDPVTPSVSVPVTMTVLPTASMGWVEGAVTDAATGDPLTATIVAVGQPYTITTNSDTGTYKLWLDAGSYNLQVSATGYATETAGITVTAQQGITQNFALRLNVPVLEVSPGSLTVTHQVGDVTTRTLTITNAGPAELTFNLTSRVSTSLRIVSDGSWRVSATPVPGWETVAFDDSSWDFTVAPAPVACGWVNCWYDPDVFTMWASDQHQTIYLRRSFFLDSGVTPISATIKTGCDDNHDLYINGTLVASDWDGSAGPTLTTDIKAHLQAGTNVIAIKADDTFGGCRSMCVDAVIVFEPAGPADWLKTNPISGSVTANSATPVQVTFDATGMQPDTYTTQILVQSNDPVTPSVSVPVTMTILPTADMGCVAGAVSDARTGTPLTATVELVGVYSMTASPDYSIWAQAGNYSLTAYASNYSTLMRSVTITAGSLITENLALEPPRKIYLPAIFRNYCGNFFDDFSNPASGWEVVNDSLVRSEYLNGEYRILTKDARFFFVFDAPTCQRQNYVVETDARWVGTPGNAYGLIFGLTDNFNQFYIFDMNTDFRQFRLLRWNSGSGSTTIVPITSAPAIKGGNASNHLKAIRNGNQITLEVNGVVLGTWSDSTITGLTNVGLLSDPYNNIPTSDARFDNFSVTALPSSSGLSQELSDAAVGVNGLQSSGHAIIPADIEWQTRRDEVEPGSK